MKIDFREMDGKALCDRCKKGFMKILSAVSDTRFIMQCSYCGEKDDLEFVKEGNKINIIMKK